MKRMTSKNLRRARNDPWDYCGLDSVCKRDCFKPEPCKIPKLIDRLAAIEDILGDEYELDRLRELVGVTKEIPHRCDYCIGCEIEPKDGHGCDGEYDNFVFSSRRLRELVEADKEGRCVVLPCKIGDYVYVIDEGDYQSDHKPYVRAKEVTEISWKKSRRGKDLGFGVILKGGDCNTSARYKFSSIGETVFLTRAEAALKAREQK